ncbi:Hypothetical predicted protein [Olea europaea subsp. europaea]|uniref:Disease resistance protein n=1 Tax=Olea europaea subsp. europaea TaxID=158383 RepID=A0A8S0PWU0_OLEEU|nr:Hypothetical predicted protein [Olea europaea subsp. europaea]
MQELRHVMIKPDILLDPPAIAENERENSIIVLEYLQTLTKIENFRCTEEVLKRIPNIKKLKICYATPSKGVEYFCLNNLVHLNKLEEFKFDFLTVIKSSLKNLTFPPSLKKLTLISGFHPWEETEIVGSLPHLQVLKLKKRAFYGPKWELHEGGFLQLKVLLLEKTNIEKWIADSFTSPNFSA